MAKASPSPQAVVKRLKRGSIPDPLGLGKPSVAIPGQRQDWKPGTRRVMGTGYVHVKLEDERGQMRVELEHRLVAERALGRPLEPGEQARHRNGDGLDNRPENLVLFRGNQPVDLEDAKRRAPRRKRGRAKKQDWALLSIPRRKPQIVRARSQKEAEKLAGGSKIAVRASRLN